MSEQIRYLGEVGLSASTYSPIGINQNSKNLDELTVPRVVIFEPGIEGGYPANQYYFEDLQDMKIATLEHDIYDPEVPENFPSLSLLVLENVINDPEYLKKKDFQQLFNFITQVVAPHGMILIIDTIVGLSRIDEKYRNFRAQMTNSGLSVVENNLHGQHDFDFEHRQEMVDLILQTMKDLGTHDRGLELGMDNYRQRDSRLLLLQQP